MVTRGIDALRDEPRDHDVRALAGEIGAVGGVEQRVAVASDLEHEDARVIDEERATASMMRSELGASSAVLSTKATGERISMSVDVTTTRRGRQPSAGGGGAVAAAHGDVGPPGRLGAAAAVAATWAGARARDRTGAGAACRGRTGRPRPVRPRSSAPALARRGRRTRASAAIEAASHAAAAARCCQEGRAPGEQPTRDRPEDGPGGVRLAVRQVAVGDTGDGYS